MIVDSSTEIGCLGSIVISTEHGASVAAAILSLIQTAIDHNLNPVDYLADLFENSDLIVKEPLEWMPWSIESTVIKTKKSSLSIVSDP